MGMQCMQSWGIQEKIERAVQKGRRALYKKKLPLETKDSILDLFRRILAKELIE